MSIVLQTRRKYFFSSAKLGDFQDGTNGGDDYTFDNNGNLKSDANKQINSITYNYLNLPQVINITGKGSISYLYDAAGNKLQKTTVDNTGSPAKTTITSYIGNIVYENDVLQFLGTEDGRIRPKGTTGFIQDFYLRDHLGNTRMVICDDQTLASPILEATSYYPFGLTMAGISMAVKTNNIENKYKFNKGSQLQNKEFSDGSGLEMYDAVNRMYDPQLGRFWQLDEFGEIKLSWSAYSFADDNPISYSDPLGLTPEDENKKLGRKKHGFTPDDPNVLTEVTVRANHSTKNLESTYWYYRMFGGGLDKAPKDIQDWLYRKDRIQRWNERVSAEGREFDRNVAEFALWFIPIPGLGELKLAGKLGQTALKLFRFRRAAGVTEKIIANGAKDYAHYGLEFIDEGVRTVEQPFAKAAESGSLALENSVSAVMGDTYSAVGEVTVQIKNTELLEALNATSKGTWVKVYEAGLLNGEKVETHYFRNELTKEVFDVKIKTNKWAQKAFKNF